MPELLRFYANTLCHAVTLTFDPLTLKVRGISSAMWSKSVRNLSEIEQESRPYTTDNFCANHERHLDDAENVNLTASSATVYVNLNPGNNI